MFRISSGPPNGGADRVNEIKSVSCQTLGNCPGIVSGQQREADMAASDIEVNDGNRRKGGGRRKQQVPIDFPDRRVGERRSGEDRRSHPRA